MTAASVGKNANREQRLQYHKAFAHLVRCEIYERLALSEHRVGDLADALPLSRCAVQRHIAVLAAAG